MQVADLKQVLVELAFDYRLDGPVDHYQDICPPCRRKLLALNQARTLHGVGSWGTDPRPLTPVFPTPDP